MPLPFEVLQKPFQFGLAEGVDPFQAPIGSLAVAENVEWLKNGMLQKRLGADQLSNDILGGGALTAGSRLITRNDELCAISNGKLYSYSPGIQKWVLIDEVPDVQLTWNTATDPAEGVSFHDICVTPAGLVVHAWAVGDPLTYAETSHADLWLRVEDANGEIVLAPQRIIATPGGVRLLYDTSSNRVIVLYTSGPTGVRIFARALDLATMALLAESTLATNWRGEVVNAAGGCFDAILDANAVSQFVIVYENTGSQLTRARITYNSGADTYAVAASVAVNIGTNIRCIAIEGNSADGFYWVAYASRSLNRLRVITIHPTTMALISGPTDLYASNVGTTNLSLKRKSATKCILAWTCTDTGVTRQILNSVEMSNLAVADSTTWRETGGARLLSRVFECDNRYFMFALRSEIPAAGTLSSTFRGVDSHLLEIDTITLTAGDYTTPLAPPTDSGIPHRYIGRIDPLVGGLSLQGSLSSVVTIDTLERRAFIPFLSTLPQGRTNFRCGLRRVDFKIASSDLATDLWRSVEFNGEAYISGSLLQAYDGRLSFDYGFPSSPIFSTTNTATPSGSMEAGNHLYGWHFEYRSMAGVLHRGPVAYSSANAGGSPQSVTFGWVTSSFTSKNDQRTDFFISTTHRPAARIGAPLFRSDANGVNYYRLSYEPNFTTIYFDPLVTQQPSITDSLATTNIGDSVNLTTRPQIYTNGGVLEDEQPPNGLTILHHRNRLWTIIGNKREVWFSKRFDDDFGVAPGFSTSFRLLFDKDLSALGAMDEKVLFFGADSIAYVTGDGPSPDGTSSDFSNATPIQTDVGCTQPRSVVSMPGGVMFADAHGIYIITRGFEIQFLGRQAQDTFDAFPIVTSAVLVSERNQVRFTLVNEDGDEGRVLVFDYLLGQWATRRYLADVPLAHALLWNGRWTAISIAGDIIVENSEEDAGAYLDDGAFVDSTIETQWISRSGPVSFQRVRRFYVLATKQTDADVAMSFYADGSSSPFESQSWLSDAQPQGGRVGIHVSKQKSFAIKGRFSDATPTGSAAVLGNGQGFLWSMLGLELADKRGLEKRAEGAKK